MSFSKLNLPLIWATTKTNLDFLSDKIDFRNKPDKEGKEGV